MADDDDARTDKRAEHRALLRKSFEALEAEQKSVPEEPERKRRRGDSNRGSVGGGARDEMMYRGKMVKRGRGMATPGAGGVGQRGRQTRASGPSTGRTPSRGSAGRSLEEALAKLADLHRDGLITRSEYDRKKQQLLDRL